ncbi:MAG: hypothetical protein ACI822_001906 [Gammaproteobacteria bacterium]|jgi:hypothetical protein
MPALLCFRKRWHIAYLLMMATMLIDLDHLFADPVYDPLRCGIGFHPLHSALPVLIYLAMLLHPKTRIIGIGLCIHIILDSIDCQVNQGIWFTG